MPKCVAPSPLETTCEICTKLLNSSESRCSPFALLCSTHGGVECTISRSALLESARAQCSFCRLMLLAVLNGEQQRGYLHNEEKHQENGVRREELRFRFKFRSKFANDTKLVQPILEVPRQDTVFSKTLSFDVGTVIGDPLAKAQTIRHPHILSLGDTQLQFSLPVRGARSDRGVPRIFSMVKGWVKSCDDRQKLGVIRRHKSGCYEPLPKMPTRLLDISQAPRKLRLIHPAPIQQVQYAALSYCWGSVKPFITTKQALSRHMDEISITKLPLTLIDGIKTARWLGLSYLWVDALCIIQDCELDKETEMAQMQHIFQHAYVTIVAARAKDLDDGFLKADNFWYPRATLPVLCENGDTGHMLLLEGKEEHPIEPRNMARERLHERGWTLQKVMLSPRLLVYGQNHVVWKCQCDDRGRVYDSTTGQENSTDWNGYCASAGLTTTRLSPTGEIIQPRLSTSIPNLLLFTDAAHTERAPKLYRVWKNIVQDYSNRSLTNPDDKLPALSGVVTYFQKSLLDEYIAGLWYAHILYEMSWTTVHPSKTVRPATWRAPSWSWMSIDGPIYFKADQYTWFEPLVTKVAHEVVPVLPLAPFSRLKSASLTLCGCLLQYSQYAMNDSLQFFISYDVKRDFENTYFPPNRLTCTPQRYWLLLFARCGKFLSKDPKNSKADESIWGILLQDFGTEDKFLRVGHFSGNYHAISEFYELSTRKTLIII